ncbi:MAG: hypothetical protein ABSC94_12300 [Polyangiaceae bacterium]
MRASGRRRAPSTPFAPLGWLAGLLAWATILTASPSNGASRIRLKGFARIDAHVARSAGELALVGTIRDDVGRPVSARVTLRVSRVGPQGLADVALAPTAPEPCSTRLAANPLTMGSATRLIASADDQGRFCLRLLLPVDRYVAHLETEDDPFIDGARLDLPFDTSKKPLTLRFDPAPSVIGLDEDHGTVTVKATFEIDGVAIPALGSVLRLSDEAGTALGEATTAADGHATFRWTSTRSGPAGQGELRVTFAGSHDVGPASTETPIERATHVHLSVPSAVGSALPAAWPEDAFTLPIVASAECLAHGCRSVASGVVEARVLGTLVGSAALSKGRAGLVLAFPRPAAETATIALRYVPDAPWFVAGAESSWVLPIAAPSSWGKVVTIGAGLAVFLWFGWTRWGAPGWARESVASRAPAAPSLKPEPSAGVLTVNRERAGDGWSGRIADAHSGAPLAGAIVMIARPSFERWEVLALTRSDGAGRFALAATSIRSDDRMVVASDLHATARRPMPPAGVVDVSLVLRKRALLDRLVQWAKERGGRYDTRPEPTPAQVRNAAASDPEIAAWANAVERAAFGAEPVDAHAEANVDILAPADAQAGPPIPPRPR